MLQSLLLPLIPVAGSVGILAVAVLGITYYQQRKHKERWSPLTSKLLRSPGHELVKKMGDMEFDILGYVLLIWIIPLMLFAIHISESYFLQQPESWFRIGFKIVAGIGIETFAAVKIVKLWDARRRIREGYEAESAVGSELNLLMLDGAQVFHDLQADNFNIDHIVVSPKGVFCVETKSRVKYLPSGSKANSNVQFDGQTLRFPTHTETAPLEQSRNNAKWLQEWLTKATGEEIKVCPVLALPGWFVSRAGRSNIVVMSGRNCRPLFSKLGAHQALTNAQIQRVVYQLDMRCRDIEPTGYRKADKKLAMA